ncbi:MAG: sulfotransferase [Phycisphaeraceae bacterium]|nr:sulfotransferase [Phycisphaeraceae bacterium]
MIQETKPAEAPSAPRIERPREIGYFFITGAHRSGTSWMTWMVNAHPQVSCYFEAYLFSPAIGASRWLDEQALNRWSEHPNPTAALRARTAPEPAPRADDVLRAARRGAIEGVLALAHKPGVRRLGDKGPVHYLDACEQLHELFPEARVIHLLRDGRDMVTSMVFHHLRTGNAAPFADDGDFERARRFWHEGEGQRVPLFNEAVLRHAALQWRRCVRRSRVARTLFGEQFLTVRYEKLLEDPTTQMRRVFGHLGVKRDDETVRACVESNRFEVRSQGRKPGEGDNAAFVRKGVVGDWREYFADRDKAIFKEIAGQALVALAYESDENW